MTHQALTHAGRAQPGNMRVGRKPRVGEVHFLVGRDLTGRWLAVEEHGRGGGIFTDRNGAMRYAMFECGHQPEAVEIVDHPLSLRF